MKADRPLVLIADDDEQLLDVLTRRCELLGLNVEIAHDGLAAISAIDRCEPDLVILDVNMPQGNGLDVCHMIAQDELARPMPVIVLTGRQDQDTIRRCHNLLAYYVQKCTNTWARIEPLLIELLHLAPPPTRGETISVDVNASTAAESASPPAEAAANGTTPDRQPPPPDAAAPANCPAGNNGRPWVICIDDDDDFSYTLMRRLEVHGVNVLRAFGGMDGYRYALMSEARAIILDYEMNGGNGDYALRRLKENPLTAHVPVIVLTGRCDKALERRMYNLGAARFFTKPVKWQHLWAELEGHLVDWKLQA